MSSSSCCSTCRTRARQSDKESSPRVNSRDLGLLLATRSKRPGDCHAAKRDHDGSLRIYDSATGTFAAYNADGTTKTFFKPGNPTYFDHQPGAPVDLRSLR